MTAFQEFFLNRKSDVMRLELLEFSHHNFSKTYRVVRNAMNGVTVHLPAPDNRWEHFDFAPLRIQRDGFDGSMDSRLSITFGDLGDVIAQELQNIRMADSWRVTPSIRYWVYRSDNLNTAIYGPISYLFTSMPYTKEGFTAIAQAPNINANGTGEIYTLTRFPMLRGFL